VRNTLDHLLLPILLLAGCASTDHQNILTLTGNPRGPATYELKESMNRQTPQGPEILAYGLLPFYNSSISINYDPKWPASGFVTYWFRAAPLAEGRYAVALLGPCKCAGPGDDEILTGVADAPQATVAQQGSSLRFELHDVPMKSRNKPDTPFRLSGTIEASPTSEKQWAKELDQFNWEYTSRTPAPPPFP
jgi:hypothetical protein